MIFHCAKKNRLVKWEKNDVDFYQSDNRLVLYLNIKMHYPIISIALMSM